MFDDSNKLFDLPQSIPLLLTKARQRDLQSMAAAASDAKVFKICDVDGDGYLTPEETGMAMRALGHTPTQKEVRQIGKAAGESGVDANDFGNVLHSFGSKPDRKDVAMLDESLRVFDLDSSGSITEAELRFVLTNLGESLSEREADIIVKSAPKNKDGEIKFEGLVQMLRE